uniref:50S ribosomal protein L28 n=1 Tax=Anisakis simplex TaxID=6269 RepID=A0A0M3JQD4_ANISI
LVNVASRQMVRINLHRGTATREKVVMGNNSKHLQRRLARRPV